MARQGLSVMKVEEIKRLLDLGRSDREIARSLQCSRNTVKQIRSGIYQVERSVVVERPWLAQLDWGAIQKEALLHPLKYIWEAQAAHLTTYSNFWKAFYQKYPELIVKTVTLRDFKPAERCEVDWAGGKVPWVDSQGEVHEAVVFVGVLGFSQLVFATARDNMQGPRFLDCHREMLDFFGGSPAVLAPDCLKTGVAKIHRYDPDLNPSYQEFARHYGLAIVPCRPSHPKDKALVEGAVRLVMRMLRWMSRHQNFRSLADINETLKSVCEKLNQRQHTRFRISRQERFEKFEKAALRPLPMTPYEAVEWKQVKLHPDCHLTIEGIQYSAPHSLRGRTLRVKITRHQIEIFHELERVAVHLRSRHNGSRVTDLKHLPENSRAYRETTPQNLLSQARFLSSELHQLLDEMFQADAMGHLRRAQGLIRESRKEIEALGHERARQNIARATELMKQYQKIRVPFLRECLNRFRLEKTTDPRNHEIQRDPLNPLIRYTHKENIEDVITASKKPLSGAETPRNSFVPGTDPEGSDRRPAVRL